MARRERETAAEAAPTENTEVTEVTEDEADEAPAEVEVDLTAFNAAVAEAIELRDETTGDIADAPLAGVTTAYRALPPKGKIAARKIIDESMKSAMNEMNIGLARAYLMIQKQSLTAASGGTGRARAERTPTDPTEAFVQLVAGLRLALDLASANVPEGVAEDWKDKARASVEEHTESGQAVVAWMTDESEDKGDAPEASGWVVGAAKLALGKSGKVGASPRSSGGSGFTGERRDIGKHIVEAFADAEVGTFLTVSQIRNHKSTEYGDNPPSAGAISARLFPKSGKFTVEGITPGQNENGKKGATKN